MKFKKLEPDYKKMFTLGAALLGAGAAIFIAINPIGVIMFALGGFSMLIGARHRDEWK